jgi:hypothetical protein
MHSHSLLRNARAALLVAFATLASKADVSHIVSFDMVQFFGNEAISTSLAFFLLSQIFFFSGNQGKEELKESEAREVGMVLSPNER